MIETATLGRSGIEARIPHRYENLLLDECSPNPDSSAAFKLNIQLGDGQGRDLFLKRKTQSSHALIVPVAMELVALSAIIGSGPVPPGHVVFFAAISNFERSGDLSFPLTGNTQKLGEKGGFHRHSGQVQSPAGSAKGDAMAFYASELPSSDGEKRSKMVPMDRDDSCPKFTHKHPAMCTLDRLRYISPDNSEIVTEYQYPQNHPLVRGHFPNNPVMMGVMQWMMVEDAISNLATRLGKNGQYKIQTNADIVRDNGIVVCELKNIVLDVYHNVSGILNQAEIASTKKIVFRDLVRPGDILRLHLTQIAIG